MTSLSMPERSPLSDWRDVNPGVAYSTADLAGLMGVSEETALRWARAGRVASLPRVCAQTPYRFLGAELLKLLGDQAAGLTGPSETPSQRATRAEAAKRRVRQLAGGQATG